MHSSRKGAKNITSIKYPDQTKKHLDPVATPNHIVVEQIDQTLDQLISHIHSLKKTVADLRTKMAEVSTPALGNGILSDEQKAALLNRRERALAKKHY